MFRVGFFGVFGGDLEGLTRGLTLWVLRWRMRLRLCCVLRGLRLGRGLTVVSFVNLCHGLVSVGQAVAASLWGERHGVALLFWGKGSRSWGEWGVWWATVVVWVGGRGVGERWGTRGASHPPPNLPLEGGRDQKGERDQRGRDELGEEE